MIAHLKLKPEPVFQSLQEHSANVADLAKRFADIFDSGTLAYLAGWLHDKGKERDTFQNYILSTNGLAPKNDAKGSHEHAFIGGVIAQRQIPLRFPFLANIIMGHHRGLYDDDEVESMLKKGIPPEIKIGPLPIQPDFPQLKLDKEDMHHFVRMLFSCLVDADYLDTEHFMQPEQSALRGKSEDLPTLLDKLEAHLSNLKKSSTDNEVNRVRNYVQQLCRNKSNLPQGVFSMTVPTGGGKTLSSLLWAMRHAIHNGQSRVIIAIPYTSIITQTASTLKAILGVENVLEHHSEFNYDEIGDECLKERYRLATENWDYPVIVTTNVQLFESLFSNKPAACRKLHNIANSVIILDEAQTLPITFLRPIIDTLDTLSRIFHTSLLLTTASQPVFSGRIDGANPSVSFNGFQHRQVEELIPKDARLHDRLRRVRLIMDDHKSNYDEIAQRLQRYDKVLCIVNTRADARELYSRLPEVGRIHLSRMMCPAHVGETIGRIRNLLKEESGIPLRVVATQLIEAGVDIDFPVVFRQEAGLDSILQAAGRCNREGHLSMGETTVFSLGKEHPLPRGFISQGNEARLSMSHYDDLFSPQAMEDYFRQLYCRANTFDAKDMKGLLYMNNDGTWHPQLEEAARRFRLIDSATTPVIVNYKNSGKLVENLVRMGPNPSLMRQLGQYSVNIHQNDLKSLQSAGAIKEIVENIYFIPSESFYDSNVGLKTENHWLEESLII